MFFYTFPLNVAAFACGCTERLSQNGHRFTSESTLVIWSYQVPHNTKQRMKPYSFSGGASAVSHTPPRPEPFGSGLPFQQHAHHSAFPVQSFGSEVFGKQVRRVPKPRHLAHQYPSVSNCRLQPQTPCVHVAHSAHPTAARKGLRCTGIRVQTSRAIHVLKPDFGSQALYTKGFRHSIHHGVVFSFGGTQRDRPLRDAPRLYAVWPAHHDPP